MIKKLWRNKWVRTFLALNLAIILSMVAFIIHVNYRTARHYEQALIHAPFDAIIVPGVPYDQESWLPILQMRISWSVQLYRDGITKNVIYSGGAVYTPYIESEIMRAYALELGIPPEHIFIEKRAEHSTENVYYAYSMARKLGFEKIALATDPFQSYFLSYFAESNHLQLAYMPFRKSLLRDAWNPNLKADTISAFVEDFVALPKREGYYERFRGTLGKKIDRLEESSEKGNPE